MRYLHIKTGERNQVKRRHLFQHFKKFCHGYLVWDSETDLHQRKSKLNERFWLHEQGFGLQKLFIKISRISEQMKILYIWWTHFKKFLYCIQFEKVVLHLHVIILWEMLSGADSGVRTRTLPTDTGPHWMTELAKTNSSQEDLTTNTSCRSYNKTRREQSGSKPAHSCLSFRRRNDPENATN